MTSDLFVYLRAPCETVRMTKRHIRPIRHENGTQSEQLASMSEKTNNTLRHYGIALCFLGAALLCGCASLPDATQGFLPSGNPIKREIRKVAKSLRRAKDDAEAAAIARAALDNLNRRVVSVPDSAHSRRLNAFRAELNRTILRADCKAAIRDAKALIEGSEEIEVKIERAEETARKLAVCLALGILEPVDECEFQAARRMLARFAAEKLCALEMEYAAEMQQSAENPDQLLQACDEAARAMEQALRADVWSGMEREELNARLAFISRKAAEISAQRDNYFKKYNEWLMQQQTHFINLHANDDLAVAGRTLDTERDKWLNWEMFGCFRDDEKAINNVLLLFDRVRRDGRVIYLYRKKAAELYNRAYAPLSSARREAYLRFPRMDPYDTSQDFPRASDEQKAEFVANLWQAARQKIQEITDNAPTIDRDGDVEVRADTGGTQ